MTGDQRAASMTTAYCEVCDEKFFSEDEGAVFCAPCHQWWEELKRKQLAAPRDGESCDIGK